MSFFLESSLKETRLASRVQLLLLREEVNVAGVNADADTARDKTATKENFIVAVQCR